MSCVIGITGTLWVACIIYMPVLLFYQVQLSYVSISILIFHGSMYSITASFIISLIIKKLSPLKLLRISLLIGIILIGYDYYCLSLSKHISFAVVSLITLHGILARLMPAIFMHKIFPIQYRLAGVYLAVNLGYTLFGILSPLIVIALIYLTHEYFFIKSLYAIVMSCVSLIALVYVNRVIEPATEAGTI